MIPSSVRLPRFAVIAAVAVAALSAAAIWLFDHPDVEAPLAPARQAASQPSVDLSDVDALPDEAASERAFAIIRAAAERLAALSPPGTPRPPALMMALHIWTMAHGVASLFARGDAARRKLPMSAEELLEAGVLVYLAGLGFTGGKGTQSR